MKQDIAKSRVKYGGSEIQRDFPSDITQKRKYLLSSITATRNENLIKNVKKFILVKVII